MDEAVTLESSLHVDGDTSVYTFDSSGATSLATNGGAVNIATSGASTTIKGTLNVDEYVTLDSSLNVSGTTTASDFVASSDYNLKENIVNLINPLERTCDLTGRNYNWRRDPSNNVTAGLIAQEVESIIPEVVNRNGEFLGINYNAIIPYLIESIKSQQERINDLEERIKTLEDK